MIGGVTRRMLPHLSGVPHLHVNRPLECRKCKNKFDCLVNEMPYIKQLRPPLNVQTDSICAEVFV